VFFLWLLPELKQALLPIKENGTNWTENMRRCYVNEWFLDHFNLLIQLLSCISICVIFFSIIYYLSCDLYISKNIVLFLDWWYFSLEIGEFKFNLATIDFSAISLLCVDSSYFCSVTPFRINGIFHSNLKNTPYLLRSTDWTSTKWRKMPHSSHPGSTKPDAGDSLNYHCF